MFNINIGEPVEEVTLGYLRSLPIFGSIDWFENYEKVRTRALFRFDLCSKEEMLLIFKDEKMALLVETLPRAKWPSGQMIHSVLLEWM